MDFNSANPEVVYGASGGLALCFCLLYGVHFLHRALAFQACLDDGLEATVIVDSELGQESPEIHGPLTASRSFRQLEEDKVPDESMALGMGPIRWLGGTPPWQGGRVLPEGGPHRLPWHRPVRRSFSVAETRVVAEEEVDAPGELPLECWWRNVHLCTIDGVSPLVPPPSPPSRELYSFESLESPTWELGSWRSLERSTVLNQGNMSTPAHRPAAGVQSCTESRGLSDGKLRPPGAP